MTYNDLQFLYDQDHKVIASYDLTGFELLEPNYQGTLYDEYGGEFGRKEGKDLFVRCNHCHGYDRYQDLGKKGHVCKAVKYA